MKTSVASEQLRCRPLDIVTACRLKDLRILTLADERLRHLVPYRQLHVYTARVNFPQFRNKLGAEVELLDEDDTILGLTLAKLASRPGPGFPGGAGWYLQQFLKFAYAFQRPHDDYYLIWDADTVPLRTLEFFDDEDRMLFTTADEYHSSYFETYRNLLRQEPHREFSFISQHIIVRKSILREMLQAIDANFPGDAGWAWKIMEHVTGTGTNLFSEYETLGHYVKNMHPDAAAFRRLPWLREGSRVIRHFPSKRDLENLGMRYAFVSFEANQRGLRRLAAQVRRWLMAPALRGGLAPT